MKIQSMLVTLAMLALATVGYKWYKHASNREETTHLRTLLNAGIPDQMESTEMDQLENSKMVSEGSQFGVRYFNESLEDAQEQLDDRLQH